jgi:glycosyltransferase involved in cell wall biosynthesis
MTTVQPFVSIGMPLYNEARYLRQSPDALLCQDYSNFELIISDNASNDGTDLICREYATRDGRVSYLSGREEPGGGREF